MSIDTVEKIKSAEESALQSEKEAREKSEALIGKAQIDAVNLKNEMIKDANEQAKQIMDKEENDAKALAESILNEGITKIDQEIKAAELKIVDSSKFIVEKIILG